MYFYFILLTSYKINEINSVGQRHLLLIFGKPLNIANNGYEIMRVINENGHERDGRPRTVISPG